MKKYSTKYNKYVKTIIDEFSIEEQNYLCNKRKEYSLKHKTIHYRLMLYKEDLLLHKDDLKFGIENSEFGIYDFNINELNLIAFKLLLNDLRQERRLCQGLV